MESDPLEELWDLSRSKTIRARVKQMDIEPHFTQDPAKAKCVVSYSEATAKSNNGPPSLFSKQEQCQATMGEATFY